MRQEAKIGKVRKKKSESSHEKRQTWKGGRTWRKRERGKHRKRRVKKKDNRERETGPRCETEREK